MANVLVISGEEQDKEIALMYAYELINNGRVEEKNIVMYRTSKKISQMYSNNIPIAHSTVDHTLVTPSVATTEQHLKYDTHSDSLKYMH